MNTLLILGDCQSNGNNCLVHEILNEKVPSTWSLKYHNQFPQVFKWYLKHRVSRGLKNGLPQDGSNLESHVWDYYWEQEGNVAWPSLVDGFDDIVNMSINGGHFIGHHKRLNEFIKEHGKPSLVILTDYTFSHIAHSFKWMGKRYVFERENYIDSEWNPEKYPKEVHLKRLSGIAKMKSKSKDWHLRRHAKSYRMLLKVLQHHGIPCIMMRFGDRDEENTKLFDTFMPREIDVVDLFYRYSTVDGEDSEIKLGVQQLIADKVKCAVSSEDRAGIF